MGLFDRLFSHTTEQQIQPDIKFGRYSDSYKLPANYDAWDNALAQFEEHNHLESFRQFFLYLRDEEEDNVRWWDDKENIQFEFLQGSKKITGVANEKSLKAEAKIARTKSLNVGFMRRLIEKNFQLKYSRFALDRENNITIVFDTYTLDSSPYKLYYALKELATNADKQDDLLLEEFKMLQEVDVTHLQELPQAEKEAKYQYFQHRVQAVLEEVDNGKLNKDQYPGGIAYLLLDLIYNLDYLIKPEGHTMEALERMHRVYFANDGKNTAQKNQALRKEMQKLRERPKEEFFKEMYRITTTFGITTPVNHDRVVGFIDSELANMDWYQENGHLTVALAVPGYIVGYSMFNYAVPKPDRDLFHLYFRITEPAYFQNLGFTEIFYDPDSKNFNKRAIKKAIDQIVDKNKPKYPKLNPATGSLHYDSLAGFAKSFLIMVRNLDVTKIE